MNIHFGAAEFDSRLNGFLFYSKYLINNAEVEEDRVVYFWYPPCLRGPSFLSFSATILIPFGQLPFRLIVELEASYGIILVDIEVDDINKLSLFVPRHLLSFF